jgi:hypothetical protein
MSKNEEVVVKSRIHDITMVTSKSAPAGTHSRFENITTGILGVWLQKNIETLITRCEHLSTMDNGMADGTRQ